MNTLIEWMHSNTVMATLLALVSVTVLRFGRAPALAHTLWLLVIIKLVTPPIFQVPIEIEPRWKPASEVARVDGAVDVQSTGEYTGVGATALARPVTKSDLLSSAISSYGSLLLILWIGGAIGWYGLAIRRAFCFHRLLRRASPAPQATQDFLQSVAQRLKIRRVPKVMLVEAVMSPVLWAAGWVPMIAFPADLQRSLSREEQESLLAHELAHYRRRDHWFRSFEFLAMGIYWWHPLLWWARRELRRAEETCCDAWVLSVFPESKRAYSKALMKTLDFLSGECVRTPAIACGIGERHTFKAIRNRFETILIMNTKHHMSWKQTALAIALAGAFLPLSGYLLTTPAFAKEAENSAVSKTITAADATLTVEERLEKLEDLMIRFVERAESLQSAQNDQGNLRQTWQLELERTNQRIEAARKSQELEARRAALTVANAQAQLDETERLFTTGRAATSEVQLAKFAAEMAQIEGEKQQLESQMRLDELQAAAKGWQIMLGETKPGEAALPE